MLVSILVLVDLILWHKFAAGLKYSIDSFNPCFGGSYIMTHTKWQGIWWINSFNPCFGGSYIMTVSMPDIMLKLFKFQSLFWWILYYDTATARITNMVIFCFNPCFGGSYIMTRKNKGNNYRKQGFQSLFWWILYYDRQITQMIVWRLSVSILVLVDLILWLLEND